MHDIRRHALHQAEPTTATHHPLPNLPNHHRPIRFSYPRIWLFVISALILMLTVAGAGWLTWQLQGRPDQLTFSIDGLSILGLVVITILTVIVHEAIHAITARALGYRVSFGLSLRMLGAYAAAWRQMIRRRDNILIALAPLTVLTLLLIPLLAVPNLLVVGGAYAALVINTAGAAGDIYLVWRLWRMPPGTLLYDVDVENMYAYYPRSSYAP
jgi:hypothetical protein